MRSPMANHLIGASTSSKGRAMAEREDDEALSDELLEESSLALPLSSVSSQNVACAGRRTKGCERAGSREDCESAASLTEEATGTGMGPQAKDDAKASTFASVVRVSRNSSHVRGLGRNVVEYVIAESTNSLVSPAVVTLQSAYR